MRRRGCYVSPTEYDEIQTFYDRMASATYPDDLCTVRFHRDSRLCEGDVELPTFIAFYLRYLNDTITEGGDVSTVGRCRRVPSAVPMVLLKQCGDECDCQDDPW